MSNLNIKFVRSYVSKNGNDTFVYTVDVPASQKEAFEKAQGDFYREDENKTPLWFTTRFVGDNAKLIITQKGKLVPDTSEFKKANSMVKQYGGNLGQEMAKQAARQLVGGKQPEAEDDAPAEE